MAKERWMDVVNYGQKHKFKPDVHLVHSKHPHLTVCGAGVNGAITTIKEGNITHRRCLGIRGKAVAYRAR